MRSIASVLALLAGTLSLVPVAGGAEDIGLPSRSEIAAVKERFVALQQLSFAAGYEYCGYVGRTRKGALAFSRMERGGPDGCTPPLPPLGLDPVASMHTHGSYDPAVPAEFPTALDMESDRREGVDGYVATPGGRLWYIDSESMIATQLCGIGCLPRDPRFRAGDDGIIEQSYTYEDLIELEASQ